MATSNEIMYVYHLPHLERRKLCFILDQNDQWEVLAAEYMEFPITTIQYLKMLIKRGSSPTEELLTLWGHQNHTVVELFILLSNMQHYQAMSEIKHLVDEKYHVLITEGERNIDALIRKLKAIPEENFNRNHVVKVDKKVVLNDAPKLQVRVQAVSTDNNPAASSEQLLQSPQQEPLKPKSPLPLSRTGKSNGFSVSDISTVAGSAGRIPQIPYEELQKSTNNWDPVTMLGRGGFGIVFKGVWKCTQVAIKRIEQKQDNPDSHNEQIRQSINELHCLNAYRHDNVLPVYGYSIGGPQPCLVYQYMSGGCLEQRLRIKDDAKVLDWEKRLNIAVGTARGLQFLHTIGDKPLIHGDIKSANILLDPCDNAKIGDFGLAREGPQSDYTHIKVSRIHGTRPYLPDEFLRAKKMSTKVDTYSFGVVLFEIATALGAYSDRRPKPSRFLRDHVIEYKDDVLELKDARVRGGEHCFRRLIDIGKECVSHRAKDRPEMVAVLVLLEGVKC